MTGLAWAPVAAAVTLVWWPMFRAQQHKDAMAWAMFEGRYEVAGVRARAAAEADRQDALAASDAARLTAWSCPQGPPDAVQRRLDEAWSWASCAATGNRASAANWMLLAELGWVRLEPERHFVLAGLPADPAEQERILRAYLRGKDSRALQERLGDVLWKTGRRAEAARLWRRANEAYPYGLAEGKTVDVTWNAAQRDPRNSRLQLNVARLSLSAGKADWAEAALNAAQRVQAALPEDSPERFTPAERQKLLMLRARIRAIRDAPKTPETKPE